eukprot:Skav227396  [mRNA]  locus=scaffold3215:255395:257705:- [translate_table: standard]
MASSCERNELAVVEGALSASDVLGKMLAPTLQQMEKSMREAYQFGVEWWEDTYRASADSQTRLAGPVPALWSGSQLDPPCLSLGWITGEPEKEQEHEASCDISSERLSLL